MGCMLARSRANAGELVSSSRSCICQQWKVKPAKGLAISGDTNTYNNVGGGKWYSLSIGLAHSIYHLSTMYLCIYLSIYLSYLCMYIHILYIHTCMYICEYTYTYTHICIYANTYIYICTYVYMHTHIYIYTHIQYITICICVYV